MRRDLETAIGEAMRDLNERDPEVARGVEGFYLEFQIPLREEPAVIDKLENRTRGIELANVRDSDQEGMRAATVFVPLTQSQFFLNRVDEYRDAETPAGRPRHEALVSRIEGARRANFQSLFTDDPALLPDADEPIWWECWTMTGRGGHLMEAAAALDLIIPPQVIRFPERDVRLVHGRRGDIEKLVRHTDAVAELRVATDTPYFFISAPRAEQAAWVGDLLARVIADEDRATAVCVLDTGVAQGHPLIAPHLDPSDMDSYEPGWGTADSHGHGTEMAGLALYGDLFPLLQSTEAVRLGHRLESVKIINASAPHDPKLYGFVTEEAVARAEIMGPNRRRVFCLAVTDSNSGQGGRPSSWSSALDSIAWGEGDTPRLIVVSAGNIRDVEPADYADRNDAEEIESPAQSWNALTVGAVTDKTLISDPTFSGWTPVAPAGGICPSSRTSVAWNRGWPVKPDVVFEGGNYASDGRTPAEAIDDLRLLTTCNQQPHRMWSCSGDTSAAAALGGEFCARVMASRSDLWPETVRALVVHSAEWTPEMLATIPADPREPDKINLVRRFGYGLPAIERARYSARNDLTLVVQDRLTPFELSGGRIRAKELQIHRFPWPHDVLESLGAADVELRVTLSYFIESNPGERGRTRRHRYPSFGLRFEVKGAYERDDAFRARINGVARDSIEGEDYGGLVDEDRWFLNRIRDRGSVHSDVWRGTGADLAQRDAIAVYPVGGWWKENRRLRRYDSSVRYALVVSVRVPDVDIDIYTPVEAAIRVPVETPVEL